MLHLIAGGLILSVALAVSCALWAWTHGLAWLMAEKGSVMLSPVEWLFLVVLVAVGVGAAWYLVSVWRNWKC